MEYIRAFITGGIICILVQILMDHTTLQPGRIMVILVITGVLLGAFGIYKKIEEFGLSSPSLFSKIVGNPASIRSSLILLIANLIERS